MEVLYEYRWRCDISMGGGVMSMGGGVMSMGGGVI